MNVHRVNVFQEIESRYKLTGVNRMPSLIQISSKKCFFLFRFRFKKEKKHTQNYKLESMFGNKKFSV